MTLPNTGPLSFQLVVDEFDIQYTFAPPVSLSGDFKKLTEDETDPTAMSELRGRSAAYVANIVVSSTTSGVYNLKQAALNDGWDGNSAVLVNFTVQSGAVLYGPGGAGGNNGGSQQDGESGSNGSLAMRTGNFNGWLVEPINMTVDGQISGGGGGGGEGGGIDDWSGSNITSQSGGNGGNGGTGLLIDGNDQVNISGSGAIYGGGGGGGGGMGAAGWCDYPVSTYDPETGEYSTGTGHYTWFLGGAGGGGGESVGGFGRGKHLGDWDGGDPVFGDDGQSGSANSAGNGGNGISRSGSNTTSGDSGDELSSGDGGNGGDNGNNGGNGEASTSTGGCDEDRQDHSRRQGGTRGYYINGVLQATFTGDWSGSVNGRVT